MSSAAPSTITQYGPTVSLTGGPLILARLISNGFGAVGGDLGVYNAAPDGAGYGSISDIAADGTLTPILDAVGQYSDFHVLADGGFLLDRQQFEAGGVSFKILRPGDVHIEPVGAGLAAETVKSPVVAPTPDGGFLLFFQDVTNAGQTVHVTYPQGGTNFTGFDPTRADDVTYQVYPQYFYKENPFQLANTGGFSVSGASGPNTAGGQTLDGGHALGNGTAVATYLDQAYFGQAAGGAGSQLVIEGVIAGPGGHAAPFQISEDPITPANAANIRVDGNGGVQVVSLGGQGFAAIYSERHYTSGTQDGYDTVIRYFDLNGTALTDEQLLFHRNGQVPLYTSADSLGDGRIAVLYADGFGGVNGNGGNQLFVDIVNPLGQGESVSAITPAPVNTQIIQSWDLAALDGGRFAVSYTDPTAGPQVRQFTAIDGTTVSNLYQAIVGRPASSGEQSYWTGQISSNAVTEAQFEHILAGTQDAGNHLPELINSEYELYTGRAAASGEVSYWQNALQSGSTDLYGFEGTLASQAGATFFADVTVDQLYRTFLGRDPAAAETAYWTGVIGQGTTDLAQAERLFASFSGAAANEAAAVTNAYETFFGRDPSSGEIGYWSGALAGGGITTEDFRGALLGTGAGQTYSAGQIAALYNTDLGRAPSTDETHYWQAQLQYGIARYVEINDVLQTISSTPNVHHASPAASQTTTLGAGFGHEVFDLFDPATNVVHFQGTQFAGFNPLAHAVQTSAGDGFADVLVTYDAADTILFKHVALSALHASDFTFG